VKKWMPATLLLAIVLGVSGCRTLSFYAQAIKGQYEIFVHEERIEKLLHDPATPQRLKEKLELLEELRNFAATDLKLPVDGHYRKYADLHRPYVVWNVQAAPEFSTEPKTWWYPFVGRLNYRGYFVRPAATNYAGYLRTKGYDVAVGGVEAYSTLGWFKDPVLNTFLFNPEPELAEIIFHELGHQRVFAHGDTDFNEAFATTVGQEGARRWLKTRGDPAGLNAYLSGLHRNSEFVQAVMRTRARLESLYGDERTPGGKVKATKRKTDVARGELRQKKELAFLELKDQLVTLKRQWGGETEYDDWLAHPIGNAHLNSVAEYYDLVPGFEELLALHNGNLEQFYEAADRLSKKSKKDRQERLRALANSHSKGIARAITTPPGSEQR
jgi:predicted aminopeptidase